MRNADLFYLEQENLEELKNKDKINDIPDKDLLLEKLRKSDNEILSVYPPEIWASSLQSKTGIRSKVTWIALAAAAAMALMITVNQTGNPVSNMTGNELEKEITRIKGPDEFLSVFREEGDRANKLKDGSRAFEGDLLQLKYSTPEEARYGFIFSLDGAGTLTQHLPLYGAKAKALDPGTSATLPYAYELDNAPDFETFYFITGKGDFDVTELINTLEESDGNVEKIVEQINPELNLYQLSLIKENKK